MGHWADILLVDDDPASRQSVASALQREGCRVRPAANAVEAFMQAARGPYDLVLLDLDMPGLSGVEALPYLRRCAPDTPIVVMTDEARGPEDRVMLRGAQCVLRKPVDLAIVVGVARLALARGSGASAPLPARAESVV